MYIITHTHTQTTYYIITIYICHLKYIPSLLQTCPVTSADSAAVGVEYPGGVVLLVLAVFDLVIAAWDLKHCKLNLTGAHSV